MQLFAKPKSPAVATTEILGLDPNLEEMELDNDLTEITPSTNQPLSIDVGLTNYGEESITSPESANICDADLQSPLSTASSTRLDEESTVALSLSNTQNQSDCRLKNREQ